jgi:hypothetical protein
MSQFAPEFVNYGVHLIFQVEFLFLQLDLFNMVLFRHMPPIEFFKPALELPMFLDQTTEFWVRGHQVLLDLLLLHHHHSSSSLGGMDSLLRP